MKDWDVEELKVACIAIVASVALIGGTVGGVTASNNAREIREAELRESARKSKAQDDLEASKVRAEKEIRQAEIQSKKRKIWERNAEGVEIPAEEKF